MIREAGDPGGIARAQSELRKSVDALQRDKKQTIEPLRQEVYRNNVQELIERLLHGERKKSEPGTSTH